MIKLSELLNENQRVYRGDCRTILDTGDLFGDATEMSSAIENSEPINHLQFLSQVNLIGTDKIFKQRLRKNTDNFKFGQYKDLVWAYDEETDIHYFFL